jgi:hypothetical protein
VAFPDDQVMFVATNPLFLKETLVRMRGSHEEKALPDTLPEWKFVNKQAQFWGLRHYAKSEANEDPSSPFGGRKTANLGQ